jgi:hypothetical protein
MRQMCWFSIGQLSMTALFPPEGHKCVLQSGRIFYLQNGSFLLCVGKVVPKPLHIFRNFCLKNLIKKSFTNGKLKIYIKYVSLGN